MTKTVLRYLNNNIQSKLLLNMLTVRNDGTLNWFQLSSKLCMHEFIHKDFNWNTINDDKTFEVLLKD